MVAIIGVTMAGVTAGAGVGCAWVGVGKLVCVYCAVGTGEGSAAVVSRSSSFGSTSIPCASNVMAMTVGICSVG